MFGTSIEQHFFHGFEDVALEDIGGAITSDVTKNLQILRVVRHVENPATEAHIQTNVTSFLSVVCKNKQDVCLPVDRMLHHEQTTVVPSPVVVFLGKKARKIIEVALTL